VTLRAIYFYVSELRFRKSTPYFLATFSCLWLSNLIPGIIVIVPAILFLGFRAAVWSAMSYAAFEIYGRRASRERLLEMLPGELEKKCPKASNLRSYILIAPFFWVIYAAFVAVYTGQILLAN